MAKEIADQIKEYRDCGVKLKIVLGIEGSPSCGVKEVSGIFMEELRSKLDELGISVPFHGIRLEHLNEDIAEIEKRITPAHGL